MSSDIRKDVQVTWASLQMRVDWPRGQANADYIMIFVVGFPFSHTVPKHHKRAHTCDYDTNTMLLIRFIYLKLIWIILLFI